MFLYKISKLLQAHGAGRQLTYWLFFDRHKVRYDSRQQRRSQSSNRNHRVSELERGSWNNLNWRTATRWSSRCIAGGLIWLWERNFMWGFKGKCINSFWWKKGGNFEVKGIGLRYCLLRWIYLAFFCLLKWEVNKSGSNYRCRIFYLGYCLLGEFWPFLWRFFLCRRCRNLKFLLGCRLDGGSWQSHAVRVRRCFCSCDSRFCVM